MKTLLSILTLAALLALSCCELFNLSKDELPPITMEGKNTFGCLIDGKLWLPKGSPQIAKVSADFTLGIFLTFRASNIHDDSGFLFFIRNIPILIDQPYQLSDTSKVHVYYDSGSCHYNKENSTIDGTLTITMFDLQASVLAGTFEFTTYNPACGDTVKITQGRFDIGEIYW